MKYVDWYERDREIRAKIHAAEIEAHGGEVAPRTGYTWTTEWGSHPSHKENDALKALVYREYTLTDRCVATVHPQGVASCPCAVFAKTMAEYENERWWNTNPLPHHFTPFELRVLADIIEIINEWVAGIRDELPASGRWWATGRRTT